MRVDDGLCLAAHDQLICNRVVRAAGDDELWTLNAPGGNGWLVQCSYLSIKPARVIAYR